MNSKDGRPRQNYRWFNSSIGSQNIPFTGTYLGDGHKITGLGAWSGGPTNLPEFSNMSKFNVNTPLFGYLSGTVEDLTLASSSISGGSAALCNNASGAHLKNVIAHDIRLRRTIWKSRPVFWRLRRRARYLRTAALRIPA